MSIDYRALIRESVATQDRPLVRQEVCLKASLYADLEEAEENLRVALMATIPKKDAEGNDIVDKRAGGVIAVPPEVVDAREARDAVAAEMAEKSITLVFKAPPGDDQNELFDTEIRTRKEDPDNANANAIKRERAHLIDCFDHAEGPGRAVLEVTREDVAPLINGAVSGLIVTIGQKLLAASTGAPDLPKSAQSLLRKRRSNET